MAGVFIRGGNLDTDTHTGRMLRGREESHLQAKETGLEQTIP